MPRVRRCRYKDCHAMVELPDHYCQQHYSYEAEYIANRQKWARSRSKSYQHRYNTVTRNRNSNKSEQYNFYRSKQWVNLRQLVLNRDYYLCQYCKVINKLTSAKTVDHIVPIEYDTDLRADTGNLATICSKCEKLLAYLAISRRSKVMMEFSKEIKQESKRIQERATEVAGLLRELEGYEEILIALGKGDAMGATFRSEKNSNTPLILYKIFERMTDVDKLAFMAMVLGLEEE